MSHLLSRMSSSTFSSLPDFNGEQVTALSKWFADAFKGLPDVIVATSEVGSAVASEIQTADAAAPFSRLFAGVRIITAPDDRYAYTLAVGEARKGNNVLLVTA